jgi:hypothetical protein
MEQFRKSLILFGLVLLVGMIYPMISLAQLPDAGCDPLDPACPIDGGVSLLIAAGIGLGARKAYQARKQSKDDQLNS